VRGSCGRPDPLAWDRLCYGKGFPRRRFFFPFPTSFVFICQFSVRKNDWQKRLTTHLSNRSVTWLVGVSPAGWTVSVGGPRLRCDGCGHERTASTSAASRAGLGRKPGSLRCIRGGPPFPVRWASFWQGGDLCHPVLPPRIGIENHRFSSVYRIEIRFDPDISPANPNDRCFYCKTKNAHTNFYKRLRGTAREFFAVGSFRGTPPKRGTDPLG